MWIRILRGIGIGLFYFWEFLLIFIFVFWIYFEITTRIAPPEIEDLSSLSWEIEQVNAGTAIVRNGWVRPVQKGVREVYVSGAPFERGASYGRLLKIQVREQEDIFVAQFERFIPSKPLLFLVGNMIRWFNQDLPQHIPLEYQKEIYGISRSFSEEYGFIGTPYERILNYHAAHDIGHALNDYQMVGCTSFAINNERSANGDLLIGRNFDFYVGEDFAKEKVILIEKPEEGYGFISYSWAGFVGVASGMNEKGLTVTINAAKSELPTASKTPISLLSREILQYASNIEEAIAIARSKEVFVSESILVGSAADQRSVIIEKAPDGMDVYDPHQDVMVCANHYQSDYFKDKTSNVENIENSDSKYRYDRVQELLQNYDQLTPEHAAAILRNQKGAKNKDIGMGNPKAINQLIAHHSVIFRPEQYKMWIAMPPYQLGKYICYDIKKIFGSQSLDVKATITVDSLSIAADDFLQTEEWDQFLLFKDYKNKIIGFTAFGVELNLSDADIQKFIASNPNSYLSYEYLGNYFEAQEKYQKAIDYYEQALTFDMPSIKDRKALQEKIEVLKDE